jgi:hypothetical protein
MDPVLNTTNTLDEIERHTLSIYNQAQTWLLGVPVINASRAINRALQRIKSVRS